MKLIPIILILLTAGCVNVHWEHPKYGKINYSRRGGQDIKGVRLMIDSNVVFSLDQQHADGDEIGEVTESITKGVVEGMKVWMMP